MHLKSLVLKGFKSFADRSVLTFEPGITAIVGPNGSGKSNISDAVLWVLGERNAKNLRGQAMEDVVFAGSSARKPVGVAEVDLILDNSDGTLPIEFNEVALTRRMYRSGESEYFINGALARRMDVLDILHDTGLGVGAHSIISQGNLDTILQSKPEDRCTLIEEAAGVLKHKQRKQKSQRKLDLMDNHLMRIKDVMAEVERQLKPLERKAKRAQAYQEIAGELAELNVALAVDDLRTLQEKWKKILEGETLLATEVEQKKLEVKQAEESMQALQEQIQTRNLNADDLARQYRRAQSILERIDSWALLLREKQRGAQTYETDIVSTLKTNARKQAQGETSHNNASHDLEKTVKERIQAEECVNRYVTEQRELGKKEAEWAKKFNECIQHERIALREKENLQQAQAENQDLLSKNRARKTFIIEQSKELESQLDQAKKDSDQKAALLINQEKTLHELEKKEQEARASVAQNNEQRSHAQKTLDSLRSEVSLLSAEIKGLEERERASDSANSARVWLLDNAHNFAAKLTPLSHVVSAPEGLEHSVEWLLGRDLQALFVSDPASIHQIIDSLHTQEKKGEIVLLPHKEMKASSQKSPSRGVSLVSLLTYPPEYEEEISALIGDVFLCVSVEEAQEASRESEGNFRFLTQEGFMIGKKGKIILDQGHEDEDGILIRRKHLEGLRKKQETSQSKLNDAEQVMVRAGKALQEAQDTSLMLSQEYAQCRGAFAAAQEEKKRAEEKLHTLTQRYENLQHQQEELQILLDSSQPLSSEHEKRLEELAIKGEEAKTQSIALRRELDLVRGQIKELNEKVSESRLMVAKLLERETYARKTLETSMQEKEILISEQKTSWDMLARKMVAQRRMHPLLVACSALQGYAKKRVSNLEKTSNEMQGISGTLHDAVRQAQMQSQGAHDAFDQVNNRLAEVRIEKGRLEVQVETAVDAIVHDCKMSLETALETPPIEDRAEIEDKAFKLRRRIANMGTINPDAAVEYEELKTRSDYMTAQLEDMMNARRALSKIVRVIDERMKKDFMVTFEQVNKNFQEMFAILFPGGSAELTLLDPEGDAQAGIEVTAQPRGKRITKMMLMSGGEKSLTALALLFSIYRVRMTPFYILDEVEAALDDTNMRRLCAYLNSLRDTTQLLLITHQRRTMELADALYGVSMQADGVTRVVGQKLSQVAEG